MNGDPKAQEFSRNPVATFKRISTEFGLRVNPFTGVGTENHRGIDISAAAGTPIVSVGEGTVIFAGPKGSAGNLVVIDHGNGITTLYMHCATVNVEVGDKVTRDKQVATVGSTGRSTAPHCHYEVRRNGIAVDPREFGFEPGLLAKHIEHSSVKMGSSAGGVGRGYARNGIAGIFNVTTDSSTSEDANQDYDPLQIETLKTFGFPIKAEDVKELRYSDLSFEDGQSTLPSAAKKDLNRKPAAQNKLVVPVVKDKAEVAKAQIMKMKQFNLFVGNDDGKNQKAKSESDKKESDSQSLKKQA